MCVSSKFHEKFSKLFSIYCQNNLVTLVMISFRIDEFSIRRIIIMVHLAMQFARLAS